MALPPTASWLGIRATTPFTDRPCVRDHWGTVVLSAPALRSSFEHPDDGHHVGLHEFTHLLDVELARFDGIPSWLSGPRISAWERLIGREMDRLRSGNSVLDPYGAFDPVEFFAVAVEAFFERAQALREGHAELYRWFAEYFCQDPAAWNDQR